MGVAADQVEQHFRAAWTAGSADFRREGFALGRGRIRRFDCQR